MMVEKFSHAHNKMRRQAIKERVPQLPLATEAVHLSTVPKVLSEALLKCNEVPAVNLLERYQWLLTTRTAINKIYT